MHAHMQAKQTQAQPDAHVNTNTKNTHVPNCSSGAHRVQPH